MAHKAWHVFRTFWVWVFIINLPLLMILAYLAIGYVLLGPD